MTTVTVVVMITSMITKSLLTKRSKTVVRRRKSL